MGAFLYIRKPPAPADAQHTAAADRALAAMQARGLPSKAVLPRQGFELHVYGKRRFDTENVLEFDNGDFIAATGTLICHGRYGEQALRELFDDVVNERLSFERLLGHFAVLVYNGGRLRVFSDYQGMYQVYCNDDLTLVSSSFVAIYESLATRTPGPQEVYEYLCFSKFYSTRTVLEELSRLDYRDVHELLPQRAATRKRIELPRYDGAAGFAAQVEATSELLSGYFGTLAEVFGDRMSLGLTGGYDSRLVLAWLRHCGATPRVYVQGPDDAADVRTAKHVAAAAGFAIEHDANEAAPAFQRDAYVDTLRTAYRYLDGLSHTGLFDKYALVAEERSRTPRPERLRLYGMAGEIYRRSLALPDRPVSFRDFFAVQTDKMDYSALRTTGPTPFDKAAFYEAVGDKMADEMQLQNRTLTAAQTELSYPHFRLATMAGWQMSAQNERAHALVPFSEPVLTYPSGSVPMRFRMAGRFQAALMQRADVALAALPSAYGYAFTDGPGLRQRAKTAVLTALPKRMLPPLYRYRARLRQSPALPFYLQDDYLAAVFPDGYPHVSTFVDITAIPDAAMLSRALTLELLFSGRLVERSA